MANSRTQFITGFCDACNEQRTISVDYIDVSNFNETTFVKSRYTACKDCPTHDCPLYKNAPHQI